MSREEVSMDSKGQSTADLTLEELEDLALSGRFPLCHVVAEGKDRERIAEALANTRIPFFYYGPQLPFVMLFDDALELQRLMGARLLVAQPSEVRSDAVRYFAYVLQERAFRRPDGSVLTTDMPQTLSPKHVAWVEKILSGENIAAIAQHVEYYLEKKIPAEHIRSEVLWDRSKESSCTKSGDLFFVRMPLGLPLVVLVFMRAMRAFDNGWKVSGSKLRTERLVMPEVPQNAFLWAASEISRGALMSGCLSPEDDAFAWRVTQWAARAQLYHELSHIACGHFSEEFEGLPDLSLGMEKEADEFLLYLLVLHITAMGDDRPTSAKELRRVFYELAFGLKCNYRIADFRPDPAKPEQDPHLRYSSHPPRAARWRTAFGYLEAIIETSRDMFHDIVPGNTACALWLEASEAAWGDFEYVYARLLGLDDEVAFGRDCKELREYVAKTLGDPHWDDWHRCLREAATETEESLGLLNALRDECATEFEEPPSVA